MQRSSCRRLSKEQEISGLSCLSFGILNLVRVPWQRIKPLQKSSMFSSPEFTLVTNSFIWMDFLESSLNFEKISWAFLGSSFDLSMERMFKGLKFEEVSSKLEEKKKIKVNKNTFFLKEKKLENFLRKGFSWFYSSRLDFLREQLQFLTRTTATGVWTIHVSLLGKLEGFQRSERAQLRFGNQRAHHKI